MTLLRVQIQPRAKKTEIAGFYGEAVKIRVKAPPVDNKANDELVDFLAECLDVKKAAVSIRSGHTGRSKVVEIEGVRADAVLRRLGLGE